MGKINVAEVMTDLMEVMKENKIMMPHGLTMLARGLTHMEGVLANIAPDINMVEIARARLAADFLHNFNFKKELKNTGRSLLKSVRKMIDLPSMTTDLMDEFMKRAVKSKPGSACVKRSCISFETLGKKYCYGSVGHGTSDQFKYYLYDGYDTEVYGDSGAWCVRISDGSGDYDLCICETYFLEEVKKEYKAKEKRDEIFVSLFLYIRKVLS